MSFPHPMDDTTGFEATDEEMGLGMNRHVRDRQFLGFTRGLADPAHRALIDAIDAVAEKTRCADMNDGVCRLDKKNLCRCRDAAEDVFKIKIKLDAEREAKFQP
jgi:hypothetical protein